MMKVSIREAESMFSQLIAAVQAGEEVVICRGDQPIVRMVLGGATAPARRFGALAGKVGLSRAFFDPLPADEVAG